MKYMLRIHQGAAPTPRSSDEWERLSEDEQKAIYREYKAINETPGVNPGLQQQPPETATTVRIQDGKTLTTDGRSDGRRHCGVARSLEFEPR